MSMQPLIALWEDSPAFRSALRSLLSLNVDGLEAVRQATQTDFRRSAQKLADEDAVGLSSEELPAAIAALETVYGIQAAVNGTPQQTVDVILGLIETPDGVGGGGIAEKAEALIRLFEQRPDFDKRERRESAQRLFFPVLETSSFGLDLRVVDFDGDNVLVPVVVARLSFDEAVQAGAAISFQFTDRSLIDLELEIQRIKQLIEEAQRRNQRDDVNGDDER